MEIDKAHSDAWSAVRFCLTKGMLDMLALRARKTEPPSDGAWPGRMIEQAAAERNARCTPNTDRPASHGREKKGWYFVSKLSTLSLQCVGTSSGWPFLDHAGPDAACLPVKSL